MSFIISNGHGGFALLNIQSRFSGVFFEQHGKMYRTLANIKPKKQQKWRDGGYCVQGDQSSLCFAPNLPVFFYEGGEAEVSLDCREIFDNRQWGRHYVASKEGDVLLIRFEKRDDTRELEKGEYSCWLAFAGANFSLSQEWVEEKGEFDESRHSPPFSRWVFKLGKASGSFVMAYAQSRDDAMKLAKQSWQSRRKLEVEMKAWASEALELAESQIERAKHRASFSLSCLQSQEGIFAGLPWFAQRWSRDELISLKALTMSGDFTLAKSIVMHWLSKLQPKGRIPGTLTATAADTGWLFVRLQDVWPKLAAKERAYCLERLEYFISEIDKSRHNGLVTCGVDETWMDSVLRGSARIEINALALASLKALRDLKKKHSLEADLKKRVRESFLRTQRGSKKVYLVDGATDELVRPNIFIAAYVYPELLSRQEWIECFDFALDRLWCDWGGITTLDKNDPNFVDTHSGEQPRSYHQGDSWYWINNLTAIVLARTDRKRYAKQIDAIAKASARDILELGAIGHHAELSSAKEQRSEGALAQAWSNALFIELAQELAKKS